MEMENEYEMEEEIHSDSSKERDTQGKRPHKGGKHIREEPTSLRELQACPFALSCFRHQSCFSFYEMVERFKSHHELARLFVTHLDNNEVYLAGVTFTFSPAVISEATGIPNVGEKWNKGQYIDREYY